MRCSPANYSMWPTFRTHGMILKAPGALLHDCWVCVVAVWDYAGMVSMVLADTKIAPSVVVFHFRTNPIANRHHDYD